MNPKRNDIIEKVKQWIEIAEEDLRVAKHSLTMKSNIPYRVIAFHCQQCAEKYLKAFLIFHNIDFPYTHDLEKLLEIAPKEYKLLEILIDTGDLTDYAVSKRYPDYYQKLSKRETDKAIESAEKVKNTINNIFLKLGYKFQ